MDCYRIKTKTRKNVPSFDFAEAEAPEAQEPAVDMGDWSLRYSKGYRVPADNRGLNYDKYFKEGDTKRATIDEFNSDNTRRLNLEETKEKIASLEYIQNALANREQR